MGVANAVGGLGRRTHSIGMECGAHTTDEEADRDSETSAEYEYRGPFPPPKDPDDIKKHGKCVWKAVFGDPAQMGPRELHIKWGEYERKMGTGYPAGWVMWEREHVKHVVVRPHERDDRPGEAVVGYFKGHGEEYYS